MSKRRFVVKFCRKAAQEYRALDQSVVGEVNEALQSLEERADEVGKPLGRKRSIDLTGSKEKKLRSTGVRIIYVISNETREVEVLRIVEVLLIDFKRNDRDVYEDANRRLQHYWSEGIIGVDDSSLYWDSEEAIKLDLNEPSMIDQIFDENFDQLDDTSKQLIIDLFHAGNVLEAYEVWRRTSKPEPPQPTT